MDCSTFDVPTGETVMRFKLRTRATRLRETSFESATAPLRQPAWP